MLLKKIFKILQLLLNVLIFFISTWIVLYAFEGSLPNLLGADLFLWLYTWVAKTIALCGLLVIVLAIIYVIGKSYDKKKSH